MSTADVFISYSHQDRDVARRYADALSAAGLSVWWDDHLRSGEAFDEKIEAALRAAKAVVVLWSKTSVASRWVRAEATLADRNKTLVPVMIEPCERPIMFELTHTSELGHWQGEAADKAWLGFLGDVRRLAEGERALQSQLPLSSAPTPKGERGEAPSVAVLPFANRSGLPEDEVFAIGMVEDVIDALSQSVNVRVIASSATARFRTGAIPDLDAMARQLGVRYLLEGNVRRSGADLRVTTQVVEASTGAILWTRKFERPLSELASLQEDLVLELAAHLGAQVYRVEMDRALRKPADLTAWEAVTRAIAAFRQIGPGDLMRAIEEARRAVAIAPDYAHGHAILAGCLGALYTLLGPDDPEKVAEILHHADRAMTLDPDNAFVLCHVASGLNWIRRPQDALRRAEQAIHLSPNFGLAHLMAGCASLMLDRSAQAIAHFDADLLATPGSHFHYLAYAWRAYAYLLAGDWSAAETALDHSIELNPDASLAYSVKAAAAAHAGRRAEGLELIAKALRLEPTLTLAQLERRIRYFFPKRSPVFEEWLALTGELWADAELDS